MSENEQLEHFCEEIHERYESEALINGWHTQTHCRVKWADLPEPNKQTMRATLRPIAARIAEQQHLIQRIHLVLSSVRNDETTGTNWLAMIENIKDDKREQDTRIAELEALIRETSEYEIHESHCRMLRNEGPCNCLTGRLHAAVPFEQKETD